LLLVLVQVLLLVLPTQQQERHQKMQHYADEDFDIRGTTTTARPVCY
jgi:hypothetical protein